MCQPLFRSLFLSAAILSTVFVLTIDSAMAQAITPSADAGRIQKDIDRQTAPPVSIAAPDDMASAPDAVPFPGAEKVSLVLKKVNVVGAQKISDAKLRSTYEHLLGTKITLVDVYAIANRIAKLYRDNGYILSRAVVPQQEIKDGAVTIRVIEGFVSGYAIQGDETGARDQIDAFAKKLVSTGALTSQNLERYLLLMNDLPGITVRSVLSPSTTATGGADMTLIVEQDRFEGMASVDNYGNSYVGHERFTLGGQLNSLFKSSDQINANILLAPDNNELQYYGLGVRHNIGSEGTKLGVRSSYTATNPTLPAALGGALGPEGSAWMVSFGAEHPFVRSRNLNVYGNVSFDVTRNKTDYDPGLGAIETKDKQRIIRVGSQMTYMDTWAGYNMGNFSLSKGLSLFGASEEGDANLSRAEGDADFTKINIDVSRMQRIAGPFTAMVGLSGQASFDPLLASEEFGFGGSDMGRGYDTSEITGDHGLAGKVELAYNNVVQKKYLDNYQVYTFYDLGAVWNRDPGAGQDARETAASVGVGTRMTFTPNFRGDAFVAKPLTRDVISRGAEADDWRFRFGVTSNF